MGPDDLINNLDARIIELTEERDALKAENLYLRQIIWRAKAVLVESVVKVFTGGED